MANFTGKNLCWSLFLIKLQVFRPATLLKRDSDTGISCEICEIFKNVFFEEHLWTTASVVSFSWNLCWSLFLINLQVFRTATFLKRGFRTDVFLWNLRNFKSTYFEQCLRTTASAVCFSWLLSSLLRHRFINRKWNVKTGVHIFRKIKNKDRLK